MLDDLSVETVDRGTTPDLPLFRPDRSTDWEWVYPSHIGHNTR